MRHGRTGTEDYFIERIEGGQTERIELSEDHSLG